MAIQYESVVPWGRNYEEYCSMFDLDQEDFKKRILGCGDGPANFNSICNRNGGKVVSLDPIYSLSKEELFERIAATFDIVMTQTKNNKDRFCWDRIRSIEELGTIRMNAMKDFLKTYEEGKQKGEYLCGALPKLEFCDNSFDIALSSHFLFLYSHNVSYDFHYQSICEMMRISRK